MSSLGFIVHIDVRDDLSDEEYAKFRRALATAMAGAAHEAIGPRGSEEAAVTGFAVLEGVELAISLVPAALADDSNPSGLPLVPSPFGPLPQPTDEALRAARDTFPVGVPVEESGPKLVPDEEVTS